MNSLKHMVIEQRSGSGHSNVSYLINFGWKKVYAPFFCSLSPRLFSFEIGWSCTTCIQFISILNLLPIHFMF